MLYALDLETDTLKGDGLNPTNPLTRITSAAICFGPSIEEGAIPGVTQPMGSVVFNDPNEARLLRSLDAWLTEEGTERGTIVTWNGANFDIPFLITRAKLHGLTLGLEAYVSDEREPKYGPCKGHVGGYIASWKGHDHADIWPAFAAHAKKLGIKSGLKPVAESFGYSPIIVDRARMHELSMAELCAYNISDVEVTYHLALRAPNFEDYLDSGLFAAAASIA
jgi:DNA polymerase elongation subunit (family B)